jgi:hypothetical protein
VTLDGWRRPQKAPKSGTTVPADPPKA